MTQDQPGQAQGTDYIVRGQVVRDDETEEFQAEPSGPMTRLKKVASALRGEQADRTIPDQTVPMSRETPDPNGSWPAHPGEPVAMSTPAPEGEHADTAHPDDGGAARSPDAEDRDYRDDERDTRETEPEQGATASDPSMTGASTYGTTENAGLRPGEATDRLGDFGDIAFGNLLPDAGQYTALWQQIQFRFVDDPEGSVTEAADVVSQVTTKLEAAIRERQRAIEERQRAIQERASALRGRWGEGSNADTETLRETLRMYRAFMNQLIGPAS